MTAGSRVQFARFSQFGQFGQLHQLGRKIALCSVVVGVALIGVGCATRQVDRIVYQDVENEIALRGYTRRGKPVDRKYNHPAFISGERVSHILSAIEVRVGDRSNTHTLYPIVTGTSLAPISSAVSQALRQADSSQMVVVKSVRRTRRFGVFTHKYLTSFIIYMESDYLHVKVSRVNWKVPSDPKAKLPEPRLGEEQMKFRVLPAKGMHSAGAQVVAARWRDPVFASASRHFERDDSGARTRTILLEESIPASELGSALPEALVDQLSPEVLRELADLEEKRRAGTITEGQYSRRRGELLRPAGR